MGAEFRNSGNICYKDVGRCILYARKQHENTAMKTLGICFGATTVQYALVQGDPGCCAVVGSGRIVHEGDPAKTLHGLLDTLDLFEIDRIAITGRRFRSNVSLTQIAEPEAVETALAEDFRGKTFPDCVVSLGGETQLVYKVGETGGIVSVHSGNKCASGTGEFFLQQIRRMDLKLDEAVELAVKGVPHRIAGRCSVFCKSDCTHALNKGEPKANIAAGLCRMIADKIVDVIKDLPRERVMLIGGGSQNTAVVNLLSGKFPRLDVLPAAPFYEAFGAAVWALSHECIKLPGDLANLVHGAHLSFGRHEPLAGSSHLVEFKENARAEFDPADKHILGLDVGSTTTKAVLMQRETKRIVASVYLRTNGDPVRASRDCYSAISMQIGKRDANIVALGVTGSGRQIAGLHALSDNVINEIIAHATAAAYFDKEVDTVFEIGGQDAKYTFLSSGVPSDYAMNEACSAGTGSFLEEAARESLNVKMEDIGSLALSGNNPPDFTDQCAAFISSDIKLAGQEGIGKEDICAGLVYSICLNYLNRVKGSRPVGRKIFMQGGVCYNRAVPAAMASLLKMPVIVPPDPGLMGAFGVALEIDSRLRLGNSSLSRFNLDELAGREAANEGNFTCGGGGSGAGGGAGAEKCDKKCSIAKIRVNGDIHPFGGICNRYYNLRMHREIDTTALDYVALRQKLLFETYGVAGPAPENDCPDRRTVGLCRSFLTHSLYPLYSRFFDTMGYRVVVSDEIDASGISRMESAYCLPAEITHGSFYNLLKKNLDYIFLPQVMQVPVANVPTFSRLCVFVQGEPYFLAATFRQEMESSPTVVLSPVIIMDKSYEQAGDVLVAMSGKMGINGNRAREAWHAACTVQRAFEKHLREAGREALLYLDRNPDTFGIVLFGRPYNAFAAEANMGIPGKVASRGHVIIPHDMLPSDKYEVEDRMFWAMGQKIMKSAQFVKNHARLFGFYITNFSCGPDSFLLTFFRNEMTGKPTLALELDQHTADAGIDTRIEAALDIMKGFHQPRRKKADHFQPAQIASGNGITVHSSDGRRLSIFDPDVEVVLPSMGRLGTEGAAAVLRSVGIRAKALPVADKEVLLTGRKNTSCKECLPYILITGSFLRYLETVRRPRTVTLLFMPSGGGPCRLGQYVPGVEQMILKNRIPDAAVLSLTNENGYAGLGSRPLLLAAQAIIVADVFSDIRSFLSVAAVDRNVALKTLEQCWKECIAYFEGKLTLRFSVLLSAISRKLGHIPLKKRLADVPVISLVGEIYVRTEEFSRQNIIDYFEKRGFMVKVAPVAEYLFYSNYVVNQGLGEKEFSLKDQMKMLVVSRVEEWWERRIKTILSESGCYGFGMIRVEKTMASARHLMNENFRGECILTVGLAMREILEDSCGVVSIGPFGCMPSRVAEAVLKKEMNADGKLRMHTPFRNKRYLETIREFPFFALETDGSPFPQIVEANLEAFCVQARRVHEKMKEPQKKLSAAIGFNRFGWFFPIRQDKSALP
jgi:predicted CoA-substrate-specific enzyme activase